jgi:hypothetical protein
VALATGDEAAVSFALLPVRTVRVSGVVIDSTGSPLSNGAVTLASDTDANEGLPLANGARVRPDGSFTITNVTPGSYTLFATAALRRIVVNGNSAGNAANEVAYVPLVVGQDDVNGLSVTTTQGATVSGTIVAERGTGTLQPNGIVVQAQPLRSGPGLNGRSAPAAASGAFSLTGLVGAQAIRVERLPQDWMVKSIEVNGVDVTNAAVEFRGTERVTDARVTLTNRITEVNGTVSARQQAANGYNVIIFPEDTAKWAFPSRYLRTTRTDAKGSFSIRALPPDEHYLAVAVDYIEEGEPSDPSFLQRIKASATPFSIDEGETKTIELKVTTR